MFMKEILGFKLREKEFHISKVTSKYPVRKSSISWTLKFSEQVKNEFPSSPVSLLSRTKAVSGTFGLCVAVIRNITPNCFVLSLRVQRKCPRRQIVRIFSCEKEALQTRVDLDSIACSGFPLHRCEAAADRPLRCQNHSSGVCLRDAAAVKSPTRNPSRLPRHRSGNCFFLKGSSRFAAWHRRSVQAFKNETSDNLHIVQGDIIGESKRNG